MATLETLNFLASADLVKPAFFSWKNARKKVLEEK